MRLSQEKETQNRQITCGVARGVDVADGHKFTLFLDIDKNFERHWRQRVGFEYDYLSFLRFRAGLTSESFSTGFGLSYRSFDFDYALRDSDFMTNHLFSLSYRFGKSREEMRIEALDAERMKVEQEAREQLRKRREKEIEKRISEAERLSSEGDFFAALGQWQGVLAWDEDNELARKAIEEITNELSRQEEERNIDIATQAAVKELFEAGIHSYTQKRYNDAINSWKRVLEIDDGHELAREYIERATEELQAIVRRHLDRAAAFHRVGEYASALNELHSALRYETSNSDIERRIEITENRIRSNDKFRRGLSSYLSKDYDSALQDFKKALELNPSNAMIREYIGLAEARKAGTTAEIQPEMERLYLEGVDLYLQGKYEDAIEVWQKILEEDPYNTKVLRNISEANERINALNNLKKK
ncbi:MAG: tetratricopeptide repeat protein [Candidatus Glassbacteria bacterium]